MDKNCLLRKFKASADGFLPRLGELAITVVEPSVFNLNLNTVNPLAIVRAPSEVLYYVDNSGNKVGSAMSECTIYDGIYNKGVTVEDGFIGNLYFYINYTGRQDWTISGGYMDLSNIDELRSVVCKNTEGGTLVTRFSKDNMFQLNIVLETINTPIDFINNAQPKCSLLSITSRSSGNYTIDVAKFIENMPNISIFTYTRGVFYGMTSQNLADFGKLANLTLLSHNNRYSWRLEDFVANKRLVGVESGTGKIEYAGDDSNGGVASFNGQKMSSSAQDFSWTSNPNTITYNGVTIEA